jgi:hypothetical protein
VDHEKDAITTLAQLVESVSSQTENDAETVHVVGRLLNRNRFVLAGDDSRSTLFEHGLASLPAVH